MENALEQRALKLMEELLGELKGEVPDYLQKLLSIEKKSELSKYCKDLVIKKEDFARLVLGCYRIGYFHQRKSNDFVPEHLWPTDQELEGLSSDGPNHELSRDGKKFVRKVDQVFKDRRFLIGHVFSNSSKWHIFFFDQRDLGAHTKSHWKEGPHIHFVNYLWPRVDPDKLWKDLGNSDADIGDSLHIRFQDFDPKGETGHAG